MANMDMHQLEKTARTCLSSAGVFGSNTIVVIAMNKKRKPQINKILMLPFSLLHNLYGPQLTRMAFETVIKCLCSTLPLHYS